MPFALPILHTPDGKLAIDAALFGEDDLLMLFSFARAYFMVDMEVPSACVQFLRSMPPRKPKSRALQRDRPAEAGQEPLLPRLLYHLKHSSDRFRIAPASRAW